jgi:4a-hydroxytetrahydrobiopterin dehydratase
MAERIYARQFHAAEGAEAWRILPEGACAFFRSDSYAASAALVGAMSALAQAGTGPWSGPSVDIRPDGVTVLIRAFKPEGYGLDQADLDLARRIARVARSLGLDAEPAAVQGLSVIPGATDRRAVMPFWQAILGYEPRPDSPEEDLVDPHGRLAPFWFENMDEPRADGGGTMHLVAWVPWDQAEARVAAGVAAGGRVVRHNVEEGFWTLADPAGNEIDIAASSPPEASA